MNIPSTIRLVLQLADVRILAIGTQGSPFSFQVNTLAKEFLHPSCICCPWQRETEDSSLDRDSVPLSAVSDKSDSFLFSLPSISHTPLTRSFSLDADYPAKRSMWPWNRYPTSQAQLMDRFGIGKSSSPVASERPQEPVRQPRLQQPRPFFGHADYPNYTEGGMDYRCPTREAHEAGWIGPLLCVESF